MCFSNLPIEFDDEGNPYLAEEADEVDGVPEAGSDAVPEAECRCSGGVPIAETDPETVYEDVLATMPSEVRERLADGVEASGDAVETSTADGHERSAGGD